MSAIPGSLWLLSLDKKPPSFNIDIRLRFTHVHTIYGKYIAAFTSEQLARQFLKQTLPKNLVIQPIELCNKNEIVEFLKGIEKDGYTHFCADPHMRAGKIVGHIYSIRDFINLIK
jgi:hypothetical protein